ncbi:hypothetical protein niasHT_038206 [Heterodera trifolii]|uniref:Uncharacterized protein n=1 Tax=Heterodera trifolii TaxID=157864 RepID=A0ABD2IPQ6_9BILA
MAQKRSRSFVDDENDIISSLGPEELAKIAQMVAEILKPTIESTIKTTVKEILAQTQSNFSQSAPSLANATHTPLPWGCPPPFAMDPCFLVKYTNFGITNQQMMVDKSKSAVLEKLPEAAEADDNDFIKGIVQDCGLGDKLDTGKEIHRHPKNKKMSDNNSSKGRIIKIPFVDTKSRDQFLKKFPLIKRQKSLPSNVFVRRDMCPPELDLLYSLRRQAYALNQSSGLFEYVVADLAIKKLPNPRPLRTR